MTNITSSCEEDEGEDFMDAPRFDVDDISELVQDNRFATQPTEYEDILRSTDFTNVLRMVFYIRLNRNTGILV